MSNFFILGLPRSRTAWLSWFLHGNSVFCGHELFSCPSNICEDFWNIKGFKYKGSADTNPIIAKSYLKDPDSTLVVIKRNPKKVIDSLCNNFGEDSRDFVTEAINIFNEELKYSERFANLVISFEDIDNELENIYKECCPSSEIDRFKLEIFSHFKVEVSGLDYNKFKEEVIKSCHY